MTRTANASRPVAANDEAAEGAPTDSVRVPLLGLFTDEQWAVWRGIVASLCRNAELDGFERGWRACADSLDTRWAAEHPAGFCDFRTPYLQGQRPRPPERVYTTKAKTPAQIRAEAAYSWRTTGRRTA